MLKRIWARGISFCFISAEKRQVSQKKLSAKAPNQHRIHSYLHFSSFHPSASTRNKPVIFWVVSYRDFWNGPSCITSKPPCDWASSQLAACSGGCLEYIRVFLYENHSHLGLITHFWPNVKGFICLFCGRISANLLDNSCSAPYTSYVNNDKERKYDKSYP